MPYQQLLYIVAAEPLCHTIGPWLDFLYHDGGQEISLTQEWHETPQYQCPVLVAPRISYHAVYDSFQRSYVVC